MNDTLKEIVRLLREGDPELQVAAAQVLGELKPQDHAVVEGLAEQLHRGDERILGRYLLTALTKIGTPDAIATLVGRLTAGDALSDQVAHLLAQMGDAAHKPLADLFSEAGPDLRPRILEILGKHVGKDAVRVLQQALLEPEYTARAGEALAHGADSLTPAQAKNLKTALTKHLSGKTLELPAPCAAQVLAVIAVLDPPGSRPTLLKFTAPDYPLEVRQSALRALAEIALTPTQVKNVLGMLEDPDFKVVQPELASVLESVEGFPDGCLPALKKLVQSKSPSLRLIALRALRSCHTAEVAKISMRYLHHQDPSFRDAAVSALSENPKAADLLVRALSTERDHDKIRVVAELLARHGDVVAKKTLGNLVEKTCKLIANDEPLGEVYFQMVMEIDGAAAADAIVDKALRMRRARRLPECLALLAHVAQTEYAPDEGRYQLAVARLLVDAGHHTNGEAAGAGDATMGYISVLVRRGFPVFERIKKENMLEPSALLRVGTHFAEAVGEERRFGVELLHHLADRHSKDRMGEQARMILRSEGY